jgi:hypothetical protein
MDPHLPIKIKQIKMSKKYQNKKPSRIKQISWVYAINQKTYPVDTIRSGKYLLFVNMNQIDTVWEIIKNATINGLFGDSSKVSTRSHRKQKKSDQHVICIYTYDSTDWNDRQRIEQNLSLLGFKNLRYKTNAKTMHQI